MEIGGKDDEHKRGNTKPKGTNFIKITSYSFSFTVVPFMDLKI